MRIAQLVDGLYIGGAERLLVTFAEAAPAHQIDPSVIALRIYEGTPYLEQFQALKTPVIEFRGRNLIDARRFYQLLRYLRQEKFDVIHVHLTYGIILGGLAGKLTGTPVVASIHNTRPDRWARLEAFALRNWATKVIAVGHEVAKAYQPWLGKKKSEIVLNAVRIPEPVDAKARLATRAKLRVEPDEILLLAVGRLAPQKGYDDLLSAMSELIPLHGEVKLAIAGMGELEGYLTSRIQELDLHAHVMLLGSRNDVPDLLAASDIFVNSSHWEGLPIAILEAMSTGLPVVATSVGDVLHIVKEQYGILVPPHAPAQLAEALNRLCRDVTLRNRLGGSARAYVTQHHSADAWVKQLSALYVRTAKGL